MVSYLFAESHGGLWKSYTETKYPFWDSADSSESHAFSSSQSSIWCWLIASAVWHWDPGWKILSARWLKRTGPGLRNTRRKPRNPWWSSGLTKREKSVCILSEFGSLISAPVSCAILTVFGLVAIFTRRDMLIGNQMRSHTFDVI